MRGLPVHSTAVSSSQRIISDSASSPPAQQVTRLAVGGHLRLELLETHYLTYYMPAPVKAGVRYLDGIGIPDNTLSHKNPHVGQQDPVAPAPVNQD